MNEATKMQEVGGVWLPAHDTHLPKWMRDRNEVVDGKLTYQYHKLTEAMKWCKQFRTAIDVGAHCGLWSMHLVKRFQTVIAFEPVAEHRACWERNVPGHDGDSVQLIPHPVGLGHERVNIVTTPGSSGDSCVALSDDALTSQGAVALDMLRIDEDGPLDFIKLDCEGYELFALLGGASLLWRHKPCVCVEQKPGRAQKYGLPERGAVTFLQSLGAKLRREMSGDFILSWD